MLFAWLRERRRRQMLTTPFPEAWHQHLLDNVWQFGYLSATDQGRLIDTLRVFIAEKNWEACRGFAITDEVKITIAAQACLLVVGLNLDSFQRVKSVLVYPGGFRAPFREYLDSGEVIEGEDDLLGQTQYGGPVAVAWDEVLAAGRGESGGVNPVLHEFAHQLDYLNGALDGTPLLSNQAAFGRWSRVMSVEYQRLCRGADRGRRTLLDPYGATNAGEFFAVATECFFELPQEMKQAHPELYDVMHDYYRQDPAKWFAGTSA